MGFPRQEHWSGLPNPPSPGDLPNPGIEPVSPAWQKDSLLLSHLGNTFFFFFIKHEKNREVKQSANITGIINAGDDKRN